MNVRLYTLGSKCLGRHIHLTGPCLQEVPHHFSRVELQLRLSILEVRLPSPLEGEVPHPRNADELDSHTAGAAAVCHVGVGTVLNRDCGASAVIELAPLIEVPDGTKSKEGESWIIYSVVDNGRVYDSMHLDHGHGAQQWLSLFQEIEGVAAHCSVQVAVLVSQELCHRAAVGVTC